MSAKRADRTKGNQMYLGPTIPGVVKHATVFKDGILSAKIEECIGQFPAMRRLIVPVEEVPKTIRELKKKKSALDVIRDRAADKFR